MHPPKRSTFDVPAMVNIDAKGARRVVDEYRITEFGLYMSREMVARRSAHWMESWLLPDLGLCVTDWWWRPGHERKQDYYLDICEITRDDGLWQLIDHYLDIVVRTRLEAVVVDVDEFVTAVSLGLLDPVSAESAVHRTLHAVDRLAAHGHDLDSWLADEGIELSWKRKKRT